MLERLRSCEAAIELLGKYDTNISSSTRWMDELDSRLKNMEALEAARAKEAWEKHVVSQSVDISLRFHAKTSGDGVSVHFYFIVQIIFCYAALLLLLLLRCTIVMKIFRLGQFRKFSLVIKLSSSLWQEDTRRIIIVS